ncbi:MAG TPA: acyltransferase [Tepidisphaeraceae bacterium]|nr:acyltransferase [Tepidisphaeraceae bacterium]
MPLERTSAHIPALDGLRGLAIILVLLFHFTPEGGGSTLIGVLTRWVSRLGWCGVDLFFVLSGFLITGILFDAKGSAHYFRNFYMRRVLRIFPLYYGALLVIFVIIPLWRPMSGPEDQRLMQNQHWLWVYAANIPQAITGDWPLETSWVKLNHFWSLAIEEHFYLVWPTIVFAFGRKTLMRICTGCMVVALVLRILAYFLWNDTAAYVLTPCRMDELAMGGLVALAARGPGGIAAMLRPARWVAAILFVLLFGIWLQRMEDLNYTVALTVLAAFFGALLVVAVAGGTASAIFSNPVLRFFGKYSYGIYVFHWILAPLFEKHFSSEKLGTAMGSNFIGVALSMGVAIGISTLVAVLSWHLYEKHFLKLKKFFEYGEKKAAPAEAEAVTGRTWAVEMQAP